MFPMRVGNWQFDLAGAEISNKARIPTSFCPSTSTRVSIAMRSWEATQLSSTSCHFLPARVSSLWRNVSWETHPSPVTILNRESEWSFSTSEKFEYPAAIMPMTDLMMTEVL